jgi:hypothetical protein
MRTVVTAICLVLTVNVSSAAAAPSTTVTVQGDSLTAAIRPHMAAALPGRVVSWSAAVGRHYWDAWPLLQRQKLGRVVVFALGTNDWRSSRAVFLKRVRAVLALAGPRRCVVMATIYDQRPIISWNAGLKELEARYGPHRMQVADWAGAVRSGRVSLADGVHPRRSADWRARAELLAAGVRACGRAQADRTAVRQLKMFSPHQNAAQK